MPKLLFKGNTTSDRNELFSLITHYFNGIGEETLPNPLRNRRKRLGWVIKHSGEPHISETNYLNFLEKCGVFIEGHERLDHLGIGMLAASSLQLWGMATKLLVGAEVDLE
jgi:hypothetical protein